MSEKTYYYKCTTCKKVIFNPIPITIDTCPICMVNRGIYTSKIVEISEEEGKLDIQFRKKEKYIKIANGIKNFLYKSFKSPNISSYERMTLEEAIRILCNYEVEG